MAPWGRVGHKAVNKQASLGSADWNLGPHQNSVGTSLVEK